MNGVFPQSIISLFRKCTNRFKVKTCAPSKEIRATSSVRSNQTIPSCPRLHICHHWRRRTKHFVTNLLYTNQIIPVWEKLIKKCSKINIARLCSYLRSNLSISLHHLAILSQKERIHFIFGMRKFYWFCSEWVHWNVWWNYYGI